MEQNKYISRKELLFFIAWSVYLIALVLDETMWAANSESFSKLLQLARYGAYGICLIGVLFDCFEQKRIILMGVLVLVTALSFLVCGNKTMLLYMLLFLGAYEISAKMVLRLSVIVQSFILFTVVSAILPSASSVKNA